MKKGKPNLKSKHDGKSQKSKFHSIWLTLKGHGSLILKNVTSKLLLDLTTLGEVSPNLDSLVLDFNIGQAQLTGHANTIDHDLDMDITDIVSKVNTILHIYSLFKIFKKH